MRKIGLRLSLVLGVAMVLAACGSAGDGGGGGGGDGGGGGGVTGNERLGIVSFSEVDNLAFTLLDVDVEASFFATSEAVVDAFVALAPELPVGTCEVRTVDLDFGDGDDDFDFPEIPGDLSATFVSLDAGASLTVEAGSSAYTTLARQTISFGGQTFYAYDNGEDFDDDESAPPVPAGMELTIPGTTAGFPAMTVDLPDVRAMVLTAPGLTGSFSPAILVDTTTTFVWEPREAGEPASYVRIFAAPSVPTVSSTYVECNVPDTGTFSFSAETRAELGAGFEATLWDFARVVRDVQVDAASGATVILDVERGVSSLGGIGF
jgi:hypothetical protein